MTATFIILGAAAITTILASGATLWIGAHWPLVRDRKWGRWILASQVLLVTAPASVWFVNDRVGEGDYLCERCGVVERSVQLCSVSIENRDHEIDDSTRATSHRYVAAFPLRDAEQHDHEWRPIGCHQGGGLFTTRVACAMRYVLAWYQDLPLVSDLPLASATVNRFAAASRAEREAVIDSYARVSAEDKTPNERFAEWRAAWRTSHSDWP